MHGQCILYISDHGLAHLARLLNIAVSVEDKKVLLWAKYIAWICGNQGGQVIAHTKVFLTLRVPTVQKAHIGETFKHKQITHGLILTGLFQNF